MHVYYETQASAISTGANREAEQTSNHFRLHGGHKQMTATPIVALAAFG